MLKFGIKILQIDFFTVIMLKKTILGVGSICEF